VGPHRHVEGQFLYGLETVPVALRASTCPPFPACLLRGSTLKWVNRDSELERQTNSHHNTDSIRFFNTKANSF